jgi:hypothetical protein
MRYFEFLLNDCNMVENTGLMIDARQIINLRVRPPGYQPHLSPLKAA